MDLALDLLSPCYPCVLNTASFGECVACVFNHDIRIFNVDDAAKPIRILSGHLNKIISLTRHPFHQAQLLSIDTSGLVITWDVFAGTPIRQFSFDKSLTFAHTSTDGVIVVVQDEAKNWLQKYSWADNNQVPEKCPKFSVKCHFNKKSSPESIAVGCESSLVAIITENLTIAIYNIKKDGRVSFLRIPKRFLARPNIHLTALALHPRFDHLAGGLSSGVIVLWRGGLHHRKPTKPSARPSKKRRRVVAGQKTKEEAEKEEEEEEEEEGESAASIITRLHWHPLAVRCLAYSSNGSFLLSGGHEAVLVKWDLTGGASSSRRRTLLPRLRAPLSAVGAVSPRLLFALLSDRSLVLLSGAAFDITMMLQGRLLRAAPGPARGLGAACGRHLTGLVTDPTTDAVVANARPGHLQWLAGHTVLDVTAENYVPLEPAAGGIPTESCATEVLLAAFSSGGAVLATYEAMILGDSGRYLRRVKWWRREDGGQWRLAHCANASHHAAFSALSFAPASGHLAATAGHVVVVWSAVEEDAWQERFVWSADAASRGSRAAVCAFQPGADPDVLGVARGRCLSLWRWPVGPVAPLPERAGRVELEAGLVQLCWPPGDILFARSMTGDVVAWRGPDLGEPVFRRAVGATALAAPAHAAWIAACTAERTCLLLDRETGEVARSLQTSDVLCCAVVTAGGLLLGLGQEEEELERLWVEPRKENGGSHMCASPSRPRPDVLLGKLEALAAQRDGLALTAPDGAERQRQRLAEAASARIRDRLEEFVSCPATCAPDLEQLALATLRLQTELSLQSTS